MLMTTLNIWFGWRGGFYCVGLWSCIFSILLYSTVRNKPSDIGYDLNISSSNAETKSNSENDFDSSITLFELLTTPFLWMVSCAYMQNNFIKNGIEDWVQLYLIGDLNLSQYEGNI